MQESANKKYFDDQNSVEKLIRRDSERIKDSEKRTINTVIGFVRNQYIELENLLQESKVIAESKAYEEKIEGLINKVEKSVDALEENQENINYDKLQWGGTGEYEGHKDKIDTVVDANEYSSALLKDVLDIFKSIDENSYAETELLNDSYVILESAWDKINENYVEQDGSTEVGEYDITEFLRFRANQSKEIANKIREAGKKFDKVIKNTNPIEINEQMIDDIANVIENNDNYQKLQESLGNGYNGDDTDTNYNDTPSPGEGTMVDNSEVEQPDEGEGFLIH